VGLLAVVACIQAAPVSAGYFVAVPVGKGVVLRSAPGGRVLAQLGRHTTFGTPRGLAVIERRGRWLGVTSDAVPNGTLGWIDARTARLRTVDTSLRVELGRRQLELIVGGSVVRAFSVGVGASASPTPIGRFAVAEKLDGRRFGPVWGCCILGLTAHQPRPPGSWSAGRDYLVAIHGGAGIGSAVSAGCLHLDDASLRYLMRVVPVGTPVFVTK
jgi:hypothetical protein